MFRIWLCVKEWGIGVGWGNLCWGEIWRVINGVNRNGMILMVWDKFKM